MIAVHRTCLLSLIVAAVGLAGCGMCKDAAVRLKGYKAGVYLAVQEPTRDVPWLA